MVRRALLLSAIFAMLMLSGCNPVRDYFKNGLKVGPQYSKAPAPVSEDWIDHDKDRRISSSMEEHRNWWKAFHDPNLDALICFASNQNLKLKEAGYRVLASRAELGIAIGEFMPQTQFMQGSFTQIGLSTAVANRQFIPTNYYPQWNYGYGLLWELDFWGKYRRAIESSSDQLDASIEYYDEVMVSLLGDIGDSYILYRYFKRLVELVNENVEYQRMTLQIAEARFRGGLTSDLDVEQGKSDLAASLAKVPQFERFARIENNRLCTLLGISPEELEKKLTKAPIPVPPREIAVGIPAQLLVRRPDVRKVEREAAAECARIGVAVADLLPHFYINGAFGYNAQNNLAMFTSPSFYGSVGPGFSWNILNYGRLLNQVKLQDAKFQANIARYQDTVVKAGAEVEDGLADFLRGQEAVKEMVVGVEAIRKASELVVVQYRAGTTDFNRVSLVQEKRINRELELAQFQQVQARGMVKTYRALGGGWEIRLDGCDEGDKLKEPKSQQPLPTPRILTPLDPNPEKK